MGKDLEKDGFFSSFFMILLSGTSLIVILSNFISGYFGNRASANFESTDQSAYYNYDYEEVTIPQGTEDDYMMMEEETPELVPTEAMEPEEVGY